MKSMTMQDRQLGFSLFELVTALGIASIMMGIAAAQLKDYDRPAQDAASQVSGFFKIVRGKAISSTAAYRIQPDSTNRIVAVYGKNCADSSMTADSKLIVDLKNGAEFTSISWSVCFNSRGLPDTNAVITIEDKNDEQRQVEVMLGGAVRML